MEKFLIGDAPPNKETPSQLKELNKKPHYTKKKAKAFCLTLLAIKILKEKLLLLYGGTETNLVLFTGSNESPAYHSYLATYHNPKKDLTPWIVELIGNTKLFYKSFTSPKNGSGKTAEYPINCNTQICDHFEIHCSLNSNPSNFITGDQIKQIFIDLCNEENWDGAKIHDQIVSNVNNLLETIKSSKNHNYPSLLNNWIENMQEKRLWNQVPVLESQPIQIEHIYSSFHFSRIKTDYKSRGVSSIHTILKRLLSNRNEDIHIYGDSGCGKTTLAKWITRDLFITHEKPAILIILNRYITELESNESLTLIDFFIEECCGNDKQNINCESDKEALLQYLEANNDCVLILDGWDKLSKEQESVVNGYLRQSPFAQLRRLVISRPIQYSETEFRRNTRKYRIRPLDVEQAKDCLINNLDLAPSIANKLDDRFPQIKFFTPFFLVIYSYFYTHVSETEEAVANFAHMLKATIDALHFYPPNMSDRELQDKQRAMQSMESIAYKLSLTSKHKKTYFYSNDDSVTKSKLITSRLSKEDPIRKQIGSPKNYLFIHPIIQSHFTSTKLVQSPQLLGKMLNNLGLAPDRTKGWILIAGLLHNNIDKYKESYDVFWKFWSDQIKKHDLFKSIYAFVAYLLNECSLESEKEKELLGGLDLRQILLDEINHGNNIEINLSAYIALCESIDLKRKLIDGHFNLEIKDKISRLLEVQEPTSSIAPKGNFFESSQKARKIIKLALVAKSNKELRHLDRFIKTFQKESRNSKINEIPEILIRGATNQKSTSLVLNSCLRSLKYYSIKTDAVKIAQLIPDNNSHFIARIISNCRSPEAINILLQKTITNTKENIELLEIMVKGKRFFNKNAAILAHQQVAKIKALNKNNLRYFTALLNLSSKYYYNSSITHEDTLLFIEKNIETIVAHGDNRLIKAVIACYQVHYSETTKKKRKPEEILVAPAEITSMVEKLKNIITTQKESIAQLNACKLLPIYCSKKSDAAFLLELIDEQSENVKLCNTIANSLMKVAPTLVVKKCYETDNSYCKKALHDWFETENVRIYKNIIYRANGRVIKCIPI